MIIKWFGTAALSFSNQIHSVLFDPFLPFNKNLPSPGIGEFAKYNNIFLTHGHFDHLLPLPQITSMNNATIFCNQATAKSLMREGINKNRLSIIKPGEKYNIGDIEITVYRGKHIQFNTELVIKTLFNRKIIKNLRLLSKIIHLAKKYHAGEVFIFGLKIDNKEILHLGSLNFDQAEEYPFEPDLLTLPFQGRSDLTHYVLPFINKLKPKALYLHHFDDSFPPISSQVDLKPFKKIIASSYPTMKVHVPSYKHDLLI